MVARRTRRAKRRHEQLSFRGASVRVASAQIRAAKHQRRSHHPLSDHPVAQVAAASRARRLILTHFDPSSPSPDPIGLAVAQRIFPATELGYDGMVVEF